MNCLSYFGLTLLSFFLYPRISGSYIIYLYVHPKPGSGSTAGTYIILTGNKGNSPETTINRFPNGTLNTAFLKDGELSIVENKFLEDYGYINKVTVGNYGHSLTLQAIYILDIKRNIWTNLTFVYPDGSVEASKSSDFLFVVNGSWSSWSDWGPCSVSCGGGSMSRERDCTEPPPANGGALCSDVRTQNQSCGNIICSEVWTSWSSWSACSTSCGNGTSERSRYCSYTTDGQSNCPGVDKEVQICPDNPQCPVKDQWNDWSDWSPCSVTCGSEGVQSRFRTCINSTSRDSRDLCPGSSTEMQNCSAILVSCLNTTFEGNWSSWGSWSSCSETCGTGNQVQKRFCNFPEPSSTGTLCFSCSSIRNNTCRSDDTKMKNCTLDPCKVTGLWSEWGPWSSCSVTCGFLGFVNRFRICLNQTLKIDETLCSGPSNDTGQCLIPLPICTNDRNDFQDNNTVSKTLFIETVNDLQQEIDELVDKVDRQKDTRNLILTQLQNLTEWRKVIDSNLSDLKYLSRHCELDGTTFMDKISGVWSYLMNLIRRGK